MTSIRAIVGPGGIALDQQDADDSYSDYRARLDAAGSVIEAPALRCCRQCNSLYCGSVCRFTPEEPREVTEAPRCRYVKDKDCDCGGRWTCLGEVA